MIFSDVDLLAALEPNPKALLCGYIVPISTEHASPPYLQRSGIHSERLVVIAFGKRARVRN